MLRVMRLPLASLRPEMREGLESLPEFMRLLAVPQEVKDLIAIPQIDGDYVNFFVYLQGGVDILPCQNAAPSFSAEQSLLKFNYETRRVALLNALSTNTSHEAEFLRILLNNIQHMVVIDKSVPVIVPFLDAAIPLIPLVAPVAAATATATTAMATKHALCGTFIWILLALALLGGSIFAYFTLLYPWPFDTEQKIAAAVSDVEKQKANELLLQKLDGLVDKTNLRLEQAYSLLGQKEAQGAISAADLLAKLQAQDLSNELADAKKAQQDAETALVKTQKEAEDALIKMQQERADESARLKAERLEAERIAQEQAEAARLEVARLEGELAARREAEAKRIAALKQATKAVVVEEKKPAPQPPAVEKKPEPQPEKTQDESLPKCETIRKQGKLPVLLMAIDGSGSMLLKMKDGQLRMDSAMQATNTVIDRVDKNVDIHAFGIQGCPFARDYGLFSSKERSNLKSRLQALDPRKHKNPEYIFTPFVSALMSMNSAAPRNADAVGIIISDGLDTCYDAPNFNICTLAKEIHAKRPKLKINIIYMGDPEELSQIKCVSEITNGKVYSPDNTSQLIKNIKQASETLVQVCR